MVLPRFRRRILLFFLLLVVGTVDAFQTVLPVSSRYAVPVTVVLPVPTSSRQVGDAKAASSSSSRTSSTSLNMFMGSDGGFLGVGGPEVFTILLVGYFVLGPSDLYKVVKEVGKFVQNIRTFSTDLSTTFENNMESSLQLEELRKAQRELNDAFSFRRSINVDPNEEAFETGAGSAQEREAAAAAAATVAAADPSAPVDPNAPRKKIRRRVRKKVAPAPAAASAVTEDPAVVSTPVTNNIPDLEMPETKAKNDKAKDETMTAEEIAEIDAEFDKYVDPSPRKEPWAFDEDKVPPTSMASTSSTSDNNSSMDQASGNRFQEQISGNWNDQILKAGDKLEPMALVMNKIALLEKEKQAAIARLEEEFGKRTELEEKYYREQRKLLEETVSEVQAAAFGVDALSKK